MTNIKNKEPFYVFTAINGVLFDGKSVIQNHGPFANAIESPRLKDSSIEALNLLLSSLEQEYDTKLVFTSRRRNDLTECMNYLTSYGFKYDKPVFATKYEEGPRGKKILNFMEDSGVSPVRKHTLSNFVNNIFSHAEGDNNFKNYVVIDSSNLKLARHIPKSHIIKTNMNNESLTLQQVEEFLSQIGITVANNQFGE